MWGIPVILDTLQEMRLQIRRASIRAEAARGTGLRELLNEGVLTEARSSRERSDTIGFSHHVLFDYAIHRLVLGTESDELAQQLASDNDLILIARPSIVLSLTAIWEADRRRESFWETALRLAEQDIPAATRLVAPALVAQEVNDAADLHPLLRAIDGGDPRASFLLRHVTGALVASGLPGRPLGSARLDVWAQVAADLITRISGETSYPLRLLVWGLAEEVETLSDDEFAALASAAGALLDWCWSQDVPAAADVSVAVEAVAKTCRADPSATEARLSPILDPTRPVERVVAEIWHLANSVHYLVNCIPGFVTQVYEVAFGRDESSTATTRMSTGQILRLTSTVGQDWGMNQYALAEAFPALLRVDPVRSLAALASACKHVTSAYGVSETESLVRFEVKGREATAIPDWSGVWDVSAHDRNTAAMLNAFEDFLSSLTSTSTVREVLTALSGRPYPSAIWRRVLKAGARNTALGRSLAEVPASVEALMSGDLAGPICELLATASTSWSPEERTGIEKAALALPSLYPQGREGAGELIRDQFLANLAAASPETSRANQIREWSPGGRPARSDPEPNDRGLAGARAEPRIPDRQTSKIREAIEPVSEFVRAHLNSAPSREAGAAAVPSIAVLRDCLSQSEAQPQISGSGGGPDVNVWGRFGS